MESSAFSFSGREEGIIDFCPSIAAQIRPSILMLCKRRQKRTPSQTVDYCFATATSYFFLATQAASVADGGELRKCARADKSLHLRQQKTNFCLPTKVRFLNDVCLRQMMLAPPMMTASPNDAWLCHVLGQTSHHCGTKWSNIIFAEQMHHIAAGDVSFDKPTIL